MISWASVLFVQQKYTNAKTDKESSSWKNLGSQLALLSTLCFSLLTVIYRRWGDTQGQLCRNVTLFFFFFFFCLLFLF